MDRVDDVELKEPSTLLAVISTIRKFSLLRSAIWKTRRSYYALKRQLLVGRPIVECGPLFEAAINEGRAFAAGKMGSVEAAGLRKALQRNSARELDRTPEPYPPYVAHTLFFNAGVFPQNAETFDRFCEVYLEAVAACDALVSWDVAGEAEIISRYCPHAALISMKGLEPYFSGPPWSRTLAGRRVLAISPFASSIEKQYENRKALWSDPDILPAFELMTIRAPLSAGLAPPESADWFEALALMKEKMDGLNYDVALIGAGAFSLPLAAHAKARGKIGIHLGGGLQILFGILGARWEKMSDFQMFFNDAWRKPSAEETPSSFKRIEDGCYW